MASTVRPSSFCAVVSVNDCQPGSSRLRAASDAAVRRHVHVAESPWRSNAQPLGDAHSSRPPATDCGLSTQMCASVDTSFGRAG